MAEQFLYVANVSAPFEQVSRACAVKEMARSRPANLCLTNEIGNHSGKHIRIKRATIAGEKRRDLAAVPAEFWPDFGKVALNLCEGTSAEGDYTILSPLALADMKSAAVAIEIGDLQAHQFGPAQTGGVTAETTQAWSE